MDKTEFKKSNLNNILTKILFKKKGFFDLRSSTWDELLKKSSSQLVLPSFYIALSKQKKINANGELLKYCRKIYELNFARNEQLLIELKEISSILNQNKINYIFLKGSALLISKCYVNLDRMIGDIDILVGKMDLIRAAKVLKEVNYKSKTDIIFSYQKHYPRLINKKKLFAIELHRDLLDNNKNLLMAEEVLNSKVYYDNMPVASSYFQALNIIYNFQINDFGYNTCEFNIRALIDLNELYSKFKIKSLPVNKYIKRVHLQFKKYNNKRLILGINKVKENKINRFRILLKKRIKLYNRVDFLISFTLSKIPKRISQIKEFIYNKKYRNIIFRRN